LETLDIKSDKQIPFEVFKRTKDSEYNAEQFRKLIDCITKSQNGVIIKIKIFKWNLYNIQNYKINIDIYVFICIL